MKLYNSIPVDIKPLVGAAKLHFVDSFDSDFTLLLRERKYENIESMINDAIKVEVNLMASGKMKHKMEMDKKKSREEGHSSGSQFMDAKFDLMMRTMEKLVDMLSLDNRPDVREAPEPQVRNLNYRRPHFPHIRKMDKRNQVDQQIIPPFPENYVVNE